MAEHYLNVLTFRLRAFDGHPLPENLTGEMAVEVFPGKSVDIETLAAEITADLGGGARRVEQRVRETSWGASGSGADLIVDIPAIISGVAAIPVIWDTVVKRIFRLGQVRELDSQTQARLAREWLAESLNVGAESIKIVNLDSIADGNRLKFEAPDGEFEVETDNSGVVRMRRA